MSKLKLKQYLNSLQKDEIITVVLELYESKKEVKEYFEYFMNPDEKAAFEKYKQVISDEYFPRRGEPTTRVAVCKKAISEFSKLHPDSTLEAELMIFFAECGCRFTFEYGDMWEQYYTAMENNFEKSLKFAARNGLLELIRPQAERCLAYSEPCGWGFHDTIGDIFEEHYG